MQAAQSDLSFQFLHQLVIQVLTGSHYGQYAPSVVGRTATVAERIALVPALPRLLPALPLCPVQ